MTKEDAMAIYEKLTDEQKEAVDTLADNYANDILNIATLRWADMTKALLNKEDNDGQKQ